MRSSARGLPLLAMLAVSCSEPDDPRPMPATTTLTGALTTGGSTTAIGSSSGSPADSTGTERLDLAVTDLPLEAMHCDKIDLVFVIDNSASMYDEQQSLWNSFPEFIGELETILPSGDYQVMVLDTDIGPWNGCYDAIFNSFDCELWCEASCPEDCDCECNSEPCAPFGPLPCDAKLGAGKIVNSAGAPCGLPDHRRFLRPEDPDPSGLFQCLATVGLLGATVERPMQALTEALGPLSEPGQCNEGFLRDDALLIVTVVTDEDDSVASLGDPSDWRAALVEAKGGHDTSVVVLGLLGDPDVPGGLCEPFDQTDDSGASAAVRLRTWVESFPFGIWGSVCEPDYVPFFRDAVESIDEACQEFIPAG